MTGFDYIKSCDLKKLAAWFCLLQQLSVSGKLRSQEEWERFLKEDICLAWKERGDEK